IKNSGSAQGTKKSRNKAKGPKTEDKAKMVSPNSCSPAITGSLSPVKGLHGLARNRSSSLLKTRLTLNKRGRSKSKSLEKVKGPRRSKSKSLEKVKGPSRSKTQEKVKRQKKQSK